MASSMDSRARLLQVTDKMQDNSKDLDHAIALTEETIQVGIGVMTNLDEQKTTMQRIIEKVRCNSIKNDLWRQKESTNSLAKLAEL